MYDWFKSKIVPGFVKKWTFLIATFAVLAPELVTLAGDHVDLLADVIPYISDSTKSLIRLVALCAIPVAAAWKQASVPPKDQPAEVAKVDPFFKDQP